MNSGEINGNHVIVSSPYYAKIRIDWQLAGQNVGGNYSTINWQAYVDFVGCDAQLNNGSVGSNVGTLWSNGGTVYNYQGNFSNHTVTLATGSFNIGADGNGNTTLNLSGSISVYGSGTSSTSGSWNLPQIQRYSNITGFSVSNLTDEGFLLSATCDLSASTINFSIDGGVTYSGGGSGNSASQQFHNLISGHTYTCYAHTVNANSGLNAYSGALTPTTALQNNFFRIRVP